MFFDFRFAQHGILPAECTTSLSPLEGTISDLRIFPNPVETNEIMIELPPRTLGSYRYEIADATGRKIVTSSGKAIGDSVLRLSLPELSSGVYSVRLMPAGSSLMYVGRFIRL